MNENIVYIPIKESTYFQLQSIKNKNENINEFLDSLLSERIFFQDMNGLQSEKMQELWDNKDDEEWAKL
ncbi:MAG TPA: hypothetical protein PK762_03190 [Candidatus Kapabacteria bacterium]|nr:hypothetical protein [Candidatus Kapabacteria bacterium]